MEDQKIITWDEHKNGTSREIYPDKEITNIACPECGRRLWRRTDVVLATYPAQYRYECDCGWYGTA